MEYVYSPQSARAGSTLVVSGLRLRICRAHGHHRAIGGNACPANEHTYRHARAHTGANGTSHSPANWCTNVHAASLRQRRGRDRFQLRARRQL